MVRPYEHVKHVPNSKPHGRHWRPCSPLFKFCKFRRKKKEIEPFDVISENSSPKGFFWPNKKKSVISLLSADSRYFQTYALKMFIIWQTGEKIMIRLMWLDCKSWHFDCERRWAEVKSANICLFPFLSFSSHHAFWHLI